MNETGTATIRPPARRFDKPRVPFREQIRSLRMLDDNREIVLDRRCIAFLCAHKEAPDRATVVGIRLPGAKPVVVQTSIAELKQWWLGDTNGETR
jgi:hypothetical protein